jgi:SNF2 family DNA or RNA helicase
MTSAIMTRKSLEPWIFDSVQYYPHQIEGVRELCRRQCFLLADEMGLGKSLQAITVFAADVARGWYEKAIVVCPLTLKGNWEEELEKFTRFPFVTLNGSPTERRLQMNEFSQMTGPRILIVNYEQVTAHLYELNELSFDVAIFDEAHYFKNYRAQRTKATLSLYSKRSFLLTGTPMLNHVNELWPLLHKMDPNAWPKYWQFVNRYVVFGGWKNKQIVGVKNERELTEKLNHYQLRRLKKDILDLPEVQIIERRVDLLPQQRKLYDKVVQELLIPNPDSASDDSIENALTKFLRLKQICGTTQTFIDEDHSSKLDLATEDSKELLDSGNPIVIFTQFRPVLAAYIKRLGNDYPIFSLHGDVPAPSRSSVVKAWGMSSQPGALVCMLQVAGIGLNMVASRHALFLDKLFVPGLNRQAIDRLHRIGQTTTQPVQVFEYICRNTIENRIQQILRTKTNLFNEIVESNTDWKRKLLKALQEDIQ